MKNVYITNIQNNRDLISFNVKDKDCAYQEEVIIPFWKNRSIRNLILKNMRNEWKNAYECGIFTEFMEQREQYLYRFCKYYIPSNKCSYYSVLLR